MRIGVTERGDGGLQYERVLQALRSSEVDGAIIITKNPLLLAKKVMDEGLPDNTVVNCTITGMGGTFLEPGVIPPQVAIDAYLAFCQEFGPERIVLRVDPIIPTPLGIERALAIASQCKSRLRISFMDLYAHVFDRIMSANPEAAYRISQFYGTGFHAPILARNEAYQRLWAAAKTEPEVCGEPGFDCTGCVSGRDIDAMGLIDTTDGRQGQQRKECACLAVKTELLDRRGRCVHNCLYCYWKD